MTAVATHIRLKKAARGDAAAFAAVYERHHQALYRYCRSILRHEEDAQDALQSTMAKAFAALQSEARDIDIKPWLFRIAHNEAISILRRRRETTELEDVPETSSPLEERVFEREELRALQMDLADLPERQRAALVLRELNGLSHAEIAQVLDATPTTVKHTIFEARNSLFACREGREMRCHDVRRMLSDGDGRTLRGRGVRAHLRTCSECSRFQADLTRRPVALKLLAPPLPTAAAASLLSSLIGGGTTAKLLACVVIAGGGATVAVETHESAAPPKAVAAAKPHHPKREKTRVTVAPTPTAVLAAAPVPSAAPAKDDPEPRTAKAKRKHAHAKHPRRKAKHAAPGLAKKQPSATPPGLAKKPAATPPGLAKKQAATKTPPGREKQHADKAPPGQAKQHADKAPPGQAKQHADKTPAGRTKKQVTSTTQVTGTVPPGKAKKDASAPPPGQAKKDAAAAIPPGQAKKDETAPRDEAAPPGQAKKDGDGTPPGQAKPDKDADKPHGKASRAVRRIAQRALHAAQRFGHRR